MVDVGNINQYYEVKLLTEQIVAIMALLFFGGFGVLFIWIEIVDIKNKLSIKMLGHILLILIPISLIIWVT